MFVITAKLNKKKIVAAILVVVIIAAAVTIILTGRSSSKEAGSGSIGATVKNNEQRVAYLESFGWEVSAEPIEEQTITIPKSFDDVYSEYNDIQLQQGFDLSQYQGLEAVRYTYQVTNHPQTTDTVVADIIVYRNQVIAGDIQCVSVDGFMAGLQFPEG